MTLVYAHGMYWLVLVDDGGGRHPSGDHFAPERWSWRRWRWEPTE